MLFDMRRLLALLAGVAALAAAGAGCTDYHYIVRTEDAPLYADEYRSSIIERMERLSDGHIGHGEPEGDPIEIEYAGREGWANREDLLIVSFPHGDYGAADESIRRARREIILEGKEWPAEAKQAIREDRLLQGMTKEQVQLAWGRPTSIRPLAPAPGGAPGGEAWTYQHIHVQVHDDVHWYPTFGAWYGYYGGGHHHHGYGYGFAFPIYAPYRHTHYHTYPVYRTVTFDA